jgi:hypothetical protein
MHLNKEGEKANQCAWRCCDNVYVYGHIRSIIAYGNFNPKNRQVNFNWNNPDNQNNALRGRGAVQVIFIFI